MGHTAVRRTSALWRDIVYTNHPPAGAYRGYGVPQGFWAVERHMEKIARDLGLDPLEFRLKNALRAGELHPFSTAWSEGREPRPKPSRPAPWRSACARGRRRLVGIRNTAIRGGGKCRETSPAARDWSGPGDAGHCHPVPGHGRGQHQDE